MSIFAAIRNWFSARIGRIAFDDVFEGVSHRNPIHAQEERDDEGPATILPWQHEADARIAAIVERRKEAIRARVEAGK